MKKSRALLILSLTFLALPVYAQEAEQPKPQLYLNEGFENVGLEDAALPDRWQILEGATPRIVEDQQHAASGSRFLRLVDGDDTNIAALRSGYYTIPRSGAEFVAQAMIRTDHDENPALFLSFTNAYGEDVANFPVLVPPGKKGEWTLVEVREAAPGGAVAVSLVLFSYPLPMGEFDFDNVVLAGPPVEGDPAFGEFENRPPPAPIKKNQVPEPLYIGE